MPKQRRAAASRSPARPVAKKSARQAKGAEGAHAVEGRQGIETRIEPAEGSAAGQGTRVKAPARRSVAARVACAPKPPEPKEAPAPAPPPRKPGLLRGRRDVRDAASRRCSATTSRPPPSSFRTSSSAIQTSASCSSGPGSTCRSASGRPRDGRPAPQDAGRVGLRRHGRAERRRRRGRARTPRSARSSEDPESDHAHYIMAVALACAGDPSMALDHLRQAIALNPENRSLATTRSRPRSAPRARRRSATALDTPPSAATRRRRIQGPSLNRRRASCLLRLLARPCPTSTSSFSRPARARG